MADALRSTGLPDQLIAANDEQEPLDPSQATMEPTEDGGALINFDKPEASQPNIAFDGNLTELFTSTELSRLGSEIIQLTDEDERSRADWAQTYARGLKLLGLKYEDRTEPWEGACGAFHPMLLESVIRFNAQAMSDLFPGSGPIKTKLTGKITEAKDRQAKRILTDLNWLATEKIRGFRDETDLMLFNLPMAGTTFRKWRYDAVRKLPAAEYILPEHLVMPYSAASLAATERFAVILNKTSNWIKAKQRAGFYRDVEVGDGVVKTTEIDEQKDKIEGKTNTNTASDYTHRLYESHIDYDFEDTDPDNITGGPVPYVITVDSVSHAVLAIRRNWKQGDAAFDRMVSVVQHKYMPGFGPYGIGLINILGGLTESATALLRQLVDAGTLANLPAGFKAKTLRIKDDSTPIGPGEFRDVDTAGQVLRDSIMPLPYKEPSAVLVGLLGQMVDEGRRIGSVADMKITDMTGQNMPVGTTLAIIERSMKVMSAVQQRLYESFKCEYQVLREIVQDFMGDLPYSFEVDEQDKGASRKTDYNDAVAVIPVADPNATTMAQRIMTNQAIIQLTQTAPPGTYDMKQVHRTMIESLGSDDADRFIPPEAEVQPADPVTENMALLTGKPVKAGVAQDHDAHISVHMAALHDPQLGAMLAQSPTGPGVLAAAAAHIQEHLAFQYRAQIEQELGVPLPPPGEPLPEDVEYQLAGLTAKAADKLLGKHKAEEQQKKILDQMQDPVLQNERRSLDIQQQKVDDKAAADTALIEQKDRALDAATRQAVIKQVGETVRATLTAEVQTQDIATTQQIEAAKLASLESIQAAERAAGV